MSNRNYFALNTLFNFKPVKWMENWRNWRVCEEKFKKRLWLMHFVWVGDGGVEMREESNRVSCSSRDGNEQERWRWKLAHSKAAAYWKSEINEAGGNAWCVWRTVDNFLDKTKSSAIPRFSPVDYHDFIDSKIAGVRTATAMAAPPIFAPCTTADLVTYNCQCWWCHTCH